MLYLGPHIALFTIKAVHWGLVDLKTAHMVPYSLKRHHHGLTRSVRNLDRQCTLHHNSVMILVFDLLPQVQLEAVLCSIGTTLGDPPPYFIS